MYSRRTVMYAGICCATLIMGLAMLGLAGVLDSTPPEPIVIKTAHDFGVVHPGQVMRRSFTLANSWKRPLRIHKIRADCGCTSTTLGKSVLGPGEQTTIEVAIQTKDYPERRRFGVIAEGEVGRSKAVFHFELSARSANVIEFSPATPSIRFGDCSMDQLPQRMQLEIRRGSYPLPWDTLECRSADPMLSVSMKPAGPDQWQLDLLLKNPDALGAFRSKLEFVFKSDGVEQPYRYQKGVDANVVGPVVAVPSSLLVGAIGQGEQIVRRIRVESREGQFAGPLELLSVATAEDGCARAKIQHDKDGAWIEAVFTGQGQDGPRSGVMVVVVKADRIYRINVGYLMLVQPSAR